MGFQVRIDGKADLTLVRRALRQVDDKNLSRQMSKRLSKATDVLRKEIPAEALRSLPSGYGPVLSRSLQFRQSTRTRREQTQVLLRTSAKGRKERRDVRAVNRGVLRHPVYGNRNRWVAQTVKPGLVDRPVDKLRPEVDRQMQAVVDWAADKITKG